MSGEKIQGFLDQFKLGTAHGGAEHPLFEKNIGA